MRWRVVSVEPIDQMREQDTASAAIIHLERNDQSARSTLTLSDTAVASGVTSFDPEEAIKPFLESARVPEFLTVDADGTATPVQ
jgi:hypothetical protein